MKNFSALYAFIVLCLAGPLIAGCNTTADTQTAEDTSDLGQISPAAGTSSNVVYFDSGSARLTPEGKEIIRATATTARERNVSTIQVAGYADRLGPSGLNEGLSQRRAEAVAAELAAQGMPGDTIAVYWFGERTLPVPTGDGMSEAENRVVTISLTSGLASLPATADICLYIVGYGNGNMLKWHACDVSPPMFKHRV